MNTLTYILRITLFVLLGSMLLSTPSCKKKTTADSTVADTPPEEDGDDDDGNPETGDTAPVAAAVNLTDRDPQGEIIITLSYTDANSDQATSCTVSDLTFVTETTPCTCSNGTCTVGVTHTTTHTGDLYGQFKYTVTANGQTSNQETVYFTTKCPGPTLATGATLTASTGSCPNYSGWNGSISAGDILALQEGGSGEGGYILAFDSNGCYKGRATSKGTPWYAVGLKMGSYANNTDSSHNHVNVLLHTRVQNANNPGVYEWSGPFSSGGSSSVTLAAYGAGGNAAKVPDDNSDASADAHLVNVGMDSVLMRYSATQAKYTTDGLKRVIADNANGQIRAYINGVERTECRIDLSAATGGCTNCVGHATNQSDRVVTDLFMPQDSAFSEITYTWYESRLVDGLPRDVWGVSKFNTCHTVHTGFANLSHSDLISSSPSSSTLRSNAVIKVRTIPNNLAASNDIYASVGTLGQDYSVAKFDYNSGSNSYNRVCTGFQGTAIAAFQNHYDSGGLSPVYGDLFTIEKDSLGIHIRKYATSGADAGKLIKTLFTDSVTPASATAFKASTTFAGQWITVVPSISPP